MKFFGKCDRICEQSMIQDQSRSTAILRSIQHLLNELEFGWYSKGVMGAVRDESTALK